MLELTGVKMEKCAEIDSKEISEYSDYYVTPVPGGVRKLMVLRLIKM